MNLILVWVLQDSHESLEELECDVLLIDTPFPMSESAFLALGISNYLIMILSEDEFSLCVEGGIDLANLARHVFDCKPAGFIVNRITGDKVTRTSWYHWSKGHSKRHALPR